MMPEKREERQRKMELYSNSSLNPGFDEREASDTDDQHRKIEVAKEILNMKDIKQNIIKKTNDGGRNR